MMPRNIIYYIGKCFTFRTASYYILTKYRSVTLNKAPYRSFKSGHLQEHNLLLLLTYTTAIMSNPLNPVLLTFFLFPLLVQAQPVTVKDTASANTKAAELQAVVVSASRQAEKRVQSPVSIEVLDSQSIRNSGQPSFF